MQKLASRTAVLLAFMSITSVAALAQGVVTEVAISPDPSYLQARVCPVTVVFNGHITINGPATVTYRIVRSDGAMSPVYTINFFAPGTQDIRETWKLGDASSLPSYSGWVAIRVLTPNPVESNHAGANFLMTCAAAPPSPQPQRARFRVSLTGFTCNRQTRDNLFERDGPGDEIFQRPYALIVERDGSSYYRGPGASGPVFGRIFTGDSFPTSSPMVLSAPPIGLGFPGLLFEGELIEGERAVAIAPTLWEWDGSSPGEGAERAWVELMSFSRDEVAEITVFAMSARLATRLTVVGSDLDSRAFTFGVEREGDFNRPIGIRDTGGGLLIFSPKFLLLTYEGAMNAVRSAGSGGDIFTINYRDPESHKGDYTLFAKVGLIP